MIMAEEITISIVLSCKKNNAEVRMAPGVRRLDQTGDAQFKSVQNIGTTTEVISTGDVTSPRFLALRSPKTAAHDIRIYEDLGGLNQIATIKSGDVMLVPGAAALYADVDTGSAELEVMAFAT